MFSFASVDDGDRKIFDRTEIDYVLFFSFSHSKSHQEENVGHYQSITYECSNDAVEIYNSFISLKDTSAAGSDSIPAKVVKRLQTFYVRSLLQSVYGSDSNSLVKVN